MGIASGLIDNIAEQVLDDILGNAGSVPGIPATVYVGLMLSAPNSDGTGVVEPAGFGYARVPVVNNLTQWPAASGRAKTHANDIVFAAAAGGTWGTLLWVGIFDALTGGNLLIADPLTNARTVNDTDVFRFLAGVSPLTITI